MSTTVQKYGRFRTLKVTQIRNIYYNLPKIKGIWLMAQN